MPIRATCRRLVTGCRRPNARSGEAVGAQGYATAYVGKWHLYSAYGVSGGLFPVAGRRTPIPASHRRGWDHWRGFELQKRFP